MNLYNFIEEIRDEQELDSDVYGCMLVIRGNDELIPISSYLIDTENGVIVLLTDDLELERRVKMSDVPEEETPEEEVPEEEASEDSE